jgi:hypothetical protein
MSEVRATNPLVDQFRKGGVPKDLRLMAAQGALPLKPEDLLELWTDLVHDKEPEIQEAATKSMTTFPAAEFVPVLKSKETPAAVLAWAVTHRKERELREAALQNTSLSDETIESLVPELPSELAELVVINQQRLLRRTSLLEALETNPSLSNDQKRRLRELRETFKIGTVEAPPPPTPPPPKPAPEPEEPELAEDSLDSPEMSEDEAMVRYLSPDERESTEKVSAVQKIYRLNTAEKMIMALKGSREERTILVRDPNRLVAAAVIGSPRLTDPEIEAFSAMKNISDEILRKIGTHKEWMKRYSIVSNLVRNLRTPIGISIGLVSRLTQRDLKLVANDRNLPTAIRQAALKLIKRGDSGGEEIACPLPDRPPPDRPSAALRRLIPEGFHHESDEN